MSYEYGVGLGTNGNVRRLALSPSALRIARQMVAKPSSDTGMVTGLMPGGGLFTGGGTSTPPPTSSVDAPPDIEDDYIPEDQLTPDSPIEGGMTTGQIALWLGLGAIVLGGGGFVIYKLATGGKKALAPEPATPTPEMP